MDASRDRRRGVPASAPAWLHDLNRAVAAAEAGAASMREDEVAALRDAAQRLGQAAGLRPAPVSEAQVAMDRFFTMLAAATMAATTTAAAELESPQLFAAGKNLGVMLCATAAVTKHRE